MFRGPASAIRRAALVIAIAWCAAGSAVVNDSAPRVFAQSPQIIDVPAGGNLQQALNAVQPGGTIRLDPRRDLRRHLHAAGQERLVLHHDHHPRRALPPAGTRINPSYKPGLAVIRSPTTISALTTAAGASYYRIVGVAFEANQNGAGDVITLGGASATSVAQLPHHIELDRVLIAGDPTVGQKRGVSVNATHVSDHELATSATSRRWGRTRRRSAAGTRLARS